MIEVEGLTLEVWCNGPLFGTVWARSRGGDQWHVVRLAARGKPNELVADYEAPGPFSDLPSNSLAVAHDIQHRLHRSMVFSDPYLSSVMGRPEDRKIVAPTDAEVELARKIVDLHKRNHENTQRFRLGHTATNAVGEAKLLELLRSTLGDEMSCSETSSTADTE